MYNLCGYYAGGEVGERVKVHILSHMQSFCLMMLVHVGGSTYKWTTYVDVHFPCV